MTRLYDRESGLRAVVAIDDTTLGPGLGGVRWRDYPDAASAEDEARRLARVMTLKNACADLPYGGAKSVLLTDDLVRMHHGTEGQAEAQAHRQAHRRAQLRAFGRFVDRLGGLYLPGVDMGTSVADLAEIGTMAHEVSCDQADPSTWTALGVFAGISAALSCVGESLAGTRVVVQGAGHVGADLARRLAEVDCLVLVADIDPVRAHAVAREVGGRVVDPAAAVITPCDVLAPCAAGKVIDRSNVDALRCRVVAGGANDVLARRDVAALMVQRSIVYVPDFVINAGGVIDIHARRAAWGPDKLEGSLLAIGNRVEGIVREAQHSGRTPVAVAEELASQRLGRPLALAA